MAITVVIITIIAVIAIVVSLYRYTLTSSPYLLSSSSSSDFARITIGDWAWIAQILVALSCLSSRITATFATARTTFVSAREGLTPEILAMISIRRLTPVPAIIALHVLSMVMMPFTDIYGLLTYLSFSISLFMIFGIGIVPYWRWKYPNLERPYKVPIIFPILFIAYSLLVACLSLYKAPRDCGIGIGMMLVGVVVYFIFVYWKNKSAWFNNALTHTTKFLQKLFMVVHQEKPTY
ncbi:cystine/glutamate transporter-like [Amphiura filiformis]|uniref:cystine/glutamate transporter-like n=1 Tax=Amphiura filiformis TaxID=82378 RepID=UPI003B21234F